MKRLFILLFFALSLTAFAQKPKLAVYMTGDDPINEIVSSRLVDDFARGSEYTIVERTASFLSELNKEHAYERTGEVDDEQIAALGQQFGVQFVCVTSVLDVWGNEKYITARIIDAETAEVVASCSSNGSIQNKSELIRALNTLSDNFSKAVGSIKQNNAKKVAVYVTRTGVRDVDVVLGDQLVSGFAKSGRYVAIERTNVFLKKLKAEQGYQQSGAVADDDLIRWGYQSGVHYVCVAKATPWGGDYWITTRMIDVKTGDVVNSSKVEGCTLQNSMDVVRVGQEIAAELSKGTLAEQAEEERLKKEAEEARMRAAEEARLRAEAEERARREAEEREIQRKLEIKRAELRDIYQKGYVVIEKYGEQYMICLTPLRNIKGTEAKAKKKYVACGFSDWEICPWILYSEQISQIASEFLHYLDITIPICTSGQAIWVTNFDKFFCITRDSRMSSINDEYQYIDGVDKLYEFKSTSYRGDSGSSVLSEYANAILMRKIK